MEGPEYLYKYHSASTRRADHSRPYLWTLLPSSELNDLYEFRVRSLYTETPDSKYRVYAKNLVQGRVFDSFDGAIAGITEI